MRGKNDPCKQKTSKEADGVQEKKDERWERWWWWRWREVEGLESILVAEKKALPNGVSVEGEGI